MNKQKYFCLVCDKENSEVIGNQDLGFTLVGDFCSLSCYKKYKLFYSSEKPQINLNNN